MAKRKRKEPFRRLAGTSRDEPTCAELAGALVGSFRGGPRDASTNKRYLEEATVADHLKHAARSTIKRAIKDYRKTLRELASGPRRVKKV